MMQPIGITFEFPAGESLLDWLKRLCVALGLTYEFTDTYMRIYASSGRVVTIDLRHDTPISPAI